MTHQLGVASSRDIIARWCALAERRLEYLTELFETGRWRRFHSERAFLENIQEAKAAVEIWRDLSSREASRDNRAIDMSWLGRANARMSRLNIRRDPVQLPQPAKVAADRQPESSIVPESRSLWAEKVLSRPATDGDVAGPVQDMAAAVAERYPLLRNRL